MENIDSSIGIVLFGAVVGWVVAYKLRHSRGKLEFGDIAALLTAVLGGAMSKYLEDSPSNFNFYGLGVGIGFFFFILVFIIIFSVAKISWKNFLDPDSSTPAPLDNVNLRDLSFDEFDPKTRSLRANGYFFVQNSSATSEAIEKLKTTIRELISRRTDSRVSKDEQIDLSDMEMLLVKQLQTLRIMQSDYSTDSDRLKIYSDLLKDASGKLSGPSPGVAASDDLRSRIVSTQEEISLLVRSLDRFVTV